MRENATTLKRQRPPDMVGYHSLRVQLIQENIDVLMAITSQKHEAAVHNVGKRLPKTEPEQKKP